MSNFAENVYSGNVYIRHVPLFLGNITSKAIFLSPNLLFKACAAMHSPLHKHSRTEIHLIIQGRKEVRIDGNTYVLQSGDLLAVPAETYHDVPEITSDLLHTSFEIDLPLDAPRQLSVPASLLHLLTDEVRQAYHSGDFHKISLYLSLVCSDLIPQDSVAENVTDYEYRIRYFFDNHYYKDVYLADLAALLHVSEKQAERLVVKYTGNKFRQELTLQRIRVAKHLVAIGAMSMAEIARYVGYQSYSGFYKAWKRYAKQE